MMERSRKNRNRNACSNPSTRTATAEDRNSGGCGGGGDSSSSSDANRGILDERVLMLVFRSMDWDPHVICVAACVSRRLRAVAGRVLFRELCFARAPRMVAALTSVGAAPGGRLGGGWHALAKLLFFCCGCAAPTRFFTLDRPAPGHFVPASRFSKTSGRSFLARRCWGDLLFVSDPCEHRESSRGGDEDLGAYRGVFRGFMRSRTRAWLIGKQAELEAGVRCPYCGARVWSMTAAGLVPRSASRRLGSHEGSLDYFVCVNGHLHGYCWLAHLSTDEEEEEEEEEEDDDVNVAL
ncbi:EID1-like F-box protein 3 [Musa acuminata AAA Group]|uniref:EID1-like F-box protein 3 n=1 Tax=Musa acuminata AAA Group TaxID=214697 RepID=UPI0031E19300